VQEYLQHNNVYRLLSQLLQQVILEKPKNVLDFLITKLETPESIALPMQSSPSLSSVLRDYPSIPLSRRLWAQVIETSSCSMLERR
jgi:hypothetical protein